MAALEIAQGLATLAMKLTNQSAEVGSIVKQAQNEGRAQLTVEEWAQVTKIAADARENLANEIATKQD